MPNKKKPTFGPQAILDMRDNPFVLIDNNYTIIGANEAYCNSYNTPHSEVVGSKCHMVHHNSKLPCHSYGEECPMQRVMESGERYEVSHVHHNRKHFPECVSVKGIPIFDENGVCYLGEEIVQIETIPDESENYSIQAIEARHIAQLLEEHNGHRRKVAEILKISERTLYRKLMSYNLRRVGKGT